MSERHPCPPPAFVLRAPISAGARLLLVALWGYAPHDWAETGTAPRVWPTRKTLAEALGCSLDTLKGQLAQASNAGYLTRVGDAWELTTGVQQPGEGAQPPAPQGLYTPGSPDARASSNPGEGVQQPGGGSQDTRGRVSGHPQKSQEDPKKTQEDPEAKRATLMQSAHDSARLSAHLAIVAQQADLDTRRKAVRAEAEHDPRNAATREHCAAVNSVGTWAASLIGRADREATRAEIAATDPRRALTPEHIAAVREAGPLWAVELERDKWATQFGEAVRELALEPAAVSALLAAWDVAAARLAKEAGTTVGLATAKLPRFAGPLPPRIGIWWPSWRAWVAEQLAPTTTRVEAGNGKSSTPLSCRAPENTPEIVTFDVEAARERTAKRRQERLEREAAGRPMFGGGA